jgi:hypothetical protein
MSESREDIVFAATLAEKSERFDEMQVYVTQCLAFSAFALLRWSTLFGLHEDNEFDLVPRTA